MSYKIIDGEKHLQAGKITYPELSEWFGLASLTLPKAKPAAKKKKLETLKKFADYHIEGRTVVIDRVISPVYSKARKIVEDNFFKFWGIIKDENDKINPVFKDQKIDTCTRVGKAMYYAIPELRAQVKESTVINYVNTIKREWYGRNYLNNDFGTKGYSEYVIINKEENDLLSEEEYKVLSKCAQRAYNLDLRAAQIDEEYHKGTITKDQRNEGIAALVDDDCYELYRDYVLEELGYIPDKRTTLIDMLSFSC